MLSCAAQDARITKGFTISAIYFDYPYAKDVSMSIGDVSYSAKQVTIDVEDMEDDQTPPTEEEKKFFWKIRGNFKGRYLNLNTENGELSLDTKTQSWLYTTKFTESEYKELAKRYHFAEDMFVKEEIE